MYDRSQHWKNHRPGCSGKRGWATYGEAADVAASFGNRVYRCPLCTMYHTAKK